jgi:hypothetical protein
MPEKYKYDGIKISTKFTGVLVVRIIKEIMEEEGCKSTFAVRILLQKGCKAYEKEKKENIENK